MSMTPTLRTTSTDSTHSQEIICAKDACWTLPDLIDYELLMEEDEAVEALPHQIKERDERIRKRVISTCGQEQVDQRGQSSPANRRWWLYNWLQFRRRKDRATGESIGEVLDSSLSSAAALFAFAGFVVGLISLLGLLAVPVAIHVPMVLLIYLGPQILLILFAVFTFLRQRYGWTSGSPALARLVGAKVVAPLFRWLASRAEEKVGHREQAHQLRAGIGLIVGRGRLHREALGWPLLCLFQWAGLLFALAVAFGMLIVAQVAHFNFGWSSTNQALTPEVVHGIAKTMALPWSWFLAEGTGYPSLEEVRLSQVFRGQPLGEAFPYLSSWWIFLFLSLFTYSCVPRACLLVYSRWRARRALAREFFTDRRSDSLFRRLALPGHRKTVIAPNPVLPSGESSHPMANPAEGESPPERIPSDHCLVLTDVEFAAPAQISVKERIAKQLQLNVFAIHQAYSPGEQEACIALLHRSMWEDGTPRILLLHRGCAPIVGGLRRFIDGCLDAIGSDGHLIFGLGGKSDFLSDAIDPEDVKLWKEFANKLKRKHTNVEVEVLTN